MIKKNERILQRKLDFLIVTPASSGGSWIFLKHLLGGLPKNLSILVTSLGKLNITREITDRRFIQIPFLNYEKYSLLFSLIPFLGLLFELPLFVASSFLILVYRPKVIIANGFMASFGVLAAAKLVRSKIVVSHRGYLNYYTNGFQKNILRGLGNYFDYVLVNSEDSKKDISAVIDSSKIAVVNHIAEDIFFEGIDRNAIRSTMGFAQRFVILFVGRIDREKNADLLLRVVEILGSDDDFLFLFVGAGEMTPYVLETENKFKHVRYKGQVYERNVLRDLYAAADLVWSYADDTYLARPAVEALAAGTPIIIPDKPAVLLKSKNNIKVPYQLVPSSIGWLVNSDAQKIADTIREIKKKKMTHGMREACRRYAITNHSPDNLKVALDRLQSVLGQT